jgi:ADP-heptose:LPS heptosyltransferase
LLIKGHSAGIGDILRSSAAWRALKDRFPQAQLHLLLLTKEPGYSSERFIARHHLLASFRSLDKRTKGLAGWRKFLSIAEEFARACQPDLIIDFEPNGLRTSILSRWLERRCRAATVGIGQVPFRGLFYTRVAVSTKRFARERNMLNGLEYTNRDFVALSALDIERNDIAIELGVTKEGEVFGHEFRRRHNLSETTPLLGLNIGCGTPDALPKRPSLAMLSKLAARLQTQHNAQLVLTGSSFESEINREFSQLHRQNHPAPVLDLANQTNLLELAGLIQQCALFISSDSGPYHMAVALRVPTLAVFVYENWPHFHHHPWVKCVCANNLDALPLLAQAADALWQTPTS